MLARRSAVGCRIVTPPSVAVLLPGVGSAGPAEVMLAVFVGVPTLRAVVTMSMLPSETLAPAAAPDARVHSTCWPVVVQVQPLPADGVTETMP